MKPRIVCTVSYKTPTGIYYVWHTVTPLETDEARITNLLMNGVQSSVTNAMNYVMDVVEDLAKKPSGKCTVLQQKEP